MIDTNSASKPVLSMHDFYTDEMMEAVKTFQDVGDLDTAIEVCDEEDVAYYIVDEHGPFPVLSTEYTHDMIFSVIPERLRAEIKFLKALTREYYMDPSLQLAKRLVFQYPRPHRFNILKDIFTNIILTNDDAWSLGRESVAFADLFLDVYVDTEIFDGQFAYQWAVLIKSMENQLNSFTMPFRSDGFPEYKWGTKGIRLYHGVEFDDDDYVARAWTLCPVVAAKFAKRFSSTDEPRDLLVMTMDYDDICKKATFYTNRRNEEEVYFVDGIDLTQFRIIPNESELSGENKTT